MIPMLIEFIVSIIGGLLGWFVLQDITNDFIDKMVTRFPTVYAPAVVTYARAMIHFSILFGLIALCFGIIVSAMRTRPEGFI